MADEVVSISLEADISKLREALAAMPEVGSKEAKKMVDGMVAHYKRAEAALRNTSKQAERDAARAAREAERAWEKSMDALKNGTEKALGMLGGPFGDVADVALDLGEKLTTAGGAAGGIGVAAAGAIAGIAALAVATKGVADAALEARDRLEAQGLAASLPPEALASLASYEAAGRDLRGEVDRLTVAVGADLAGELAVATRAFTEGVVAIRDIRAAALDARTAFGGLLEDFQGVTRGVYFLATAGLSEVLLDYAEDTREVTDAQGELLEAERRRQGMIAEQTAAVKSYEKAHDAVVKAATKTADGEEALADAWRESQRQLDAMARSMDELVEQENLAGQEGYKASLLALDGYLRQQRELARIPTMVDAVVAKFQEWEAELDRLDNGWNQASAAIDTFAERANQVLNNPVADAMSDSVSNLITLMAQHNEKALEDVAERRGAALDEIALDKKRAEARIDQEVELGILSEEGAKQRRKDLQEDLKARRAHANATAAEEREALMKGWRRNQALQIAAATIDAGRAAMAMIPAFVPVVGPFAPAAAATAAGTALAVQIANIKAVEPPEFPMGRSPDHTVDARLREDEAVLNGRATDRLGRDVIDALNKGREVRGGDVIFQVDSRTLAEAAMPHLAGLVRVRAKGSRRLGQRNPYLGRS